MADAACLTCDHLPCRCWEHPVVGVSIGISPERLRAIQEIERAHALLAGIIGKRGPTLDATVELVRAQMVDVIETNAVLAQRVLELERKLGEVP